MSTTEYTVTGMTCENCERHVREEVSQILGVTGVEVNHRTGRLLVTAPQGAAPEHTVIEAVREAGYEAVRTP